VAELVFLLLITLGLFLGTVVPFYLAPYGFYNGLDILTELYGLWFFLCIVLVGTGIIYYIFERRATTRKITSPP
jgi:hypothetical protein